MGKTEVFLSLGTNLGDRRANIDKAISLLKERIDGSLTGMSEVMETKAVGFDGADFLNTVVRFETDTKPHSLLAICKDIERDMGRNDLPQYDPEGNRIYHDRVIDIDILIYGNQVIDSQILTIPHKALHQRPFFVDMIEQIRR